MCVLMGQVWSVKWNAVEHGIGGENMGFGINWLHSPLHHTYWLYVALRSLLNFSNLQLFGITYFTEFLWSLYIIQNCYEANS